MDFTVEAVQSSTLARRIRDALMDRILSGKLRPGTRLKDNEIAASFGTSNTPVREALRLLVRDGLVEILPYRGCTVRSIDLQEVQELFGLRTVLEGYAVRQAAERLTPRWLAQLSAAVVEHEAALVRGDREQAGATAGHFRQLLIEATGNGTLARALQHMDNRLHVACSVFLREMPDSGYLPCRAILEALRAHDVGRAEALIADHIALVKDRACRAIEDLGQEA